MCVCCEKCVCVCGVCVCDVREGQILEDKHIHS